MTFKSLLNQQNVQEQFEKVLKNRAAGFTANLGVMVNNSEALRKCDPITVISAAVVSASLDLALDPNLGFAAIVPYGDRATFQIMYKGLIQLAMRSGQYKTINVTEVYDGELISSNRITGEHVFDMTQKKSDKVIGYAAYFKLLNGFEKTEYWNIAKVEKHGKRFSQTYKKGFGMWKDDFDAMARKTVLKSLINVWGIKSIEMQDAVIFDQCIVKNVETKEVEYVDNKIVQQVDENPKAVVRGTTAKSEIGNEFSTINMDEIPKEGQLL